MKPNDPCSDCGQLVKIYEDRCPNCDKHLHYPNVTAAELERDDLDSQYAYELMNQVPLEEVKDRLLFLNDADQVKYLALCGLDPLLDEETRLECIAEVDSTIKKRLVGTYENPYWNFLEKTLLSEPLPDEADIDSGLSFCSKADAYRLERLYELMNETKDEAMIWQHLWLKYSAKYLMEAQLRESRWLLVNLGVVCNMIKGDYFKNGDTLFEAVGIVEHHWEAANKADVVKTLQAMLNDKHYRSLLEIREKDIKPHEVYLAS